MGNMTSKSTNRNPVTLPCGSIYEGELYEKKPHGYGRLKSPTVGIYEGLFVHGHKSGRGKMFYKNGEFYNGEW